MSENLISVIIGAVVTLTVTIITQVYNAFISWIKEKHESKKENFKVKREKLTEIYKRLIFVINSFPTENPTYILRNIDFAPNYSLENFDAVLENIDFQIEDYEEKLKKSYITLEQKNDFNLQISNRKYAKERIINIRNKYYKAQENYNVFCERDKSTFDIYAGQEVRNKLINFEVVIHNAFVAGLNVGDAYDPSKNTIEVSKQNLINSMRVDLGTVDRKH